MTQEAHEFRLVLCAAGSDEQAVTIARELVERRLAACVNIVAAACSIYRWQGKIEEEEERLLLIKTSRSLFPEVRQAIRDLHSYETPEVLSLPIEDGDPAYLRWLGESLAPQGRR